MRVILPYNTKEDCQSRFDSYGKVKTPGIWTTPCKMMMIVIFIKKIKIIKIQEVNVVIMDIVNYLKGCYI